MQTASLMLLLACCAQVDEPEESDLRPEPLKAAIADRFIAGKLRRISITFEPEVLSRVGRFRISVDDASVDLENFDRWLFDSEKPADPGPALQAILRSRIEAIARNVSLTAAQTAKLRLAGAGDIKRFKDLIEEKRIAFEHDRRRFRTGREALHSLAPLIASYRNGPFGEGSLFAKTLEKINRERVVVAPGSAG